MSRRHLAAPLALLLLAGRAAAGEPAVSEIPIPAIAPGPALTLAEALHQAEARSPSLAGARADVAAAEAQLASAWGTLLPVPAGA